MKVIIILVLFILSSSLIGKEVAPISAFVAISEGSGRLDPSFFGHSAYVFEFSDGSQKLYGYTPALDEAGIKDFLKTLGIGKSLPVLVHTSNYSSYYDETVIKDNRSMKLLKVKDDYVKRLYEYVNQQYYGEIPMKESYSLTTNNCASILCDTLSHIYENKDPKMCSSSKAHKPSTLGAYLKDIGFVLDEINISSGSDQRENIIGEIQDDCLTKRLRADIISKSTVKRHAALVLLSYKNKTKKCKKAGLIDEAIDELLKVEISSIKNYFDPSDYNISTIAKGAMEANKRTEVLGTELDNGKIEVRLRVRNSPYQRFKKNKGLYSYRTKTIELDNLKSFDPKEEYTISVEFNKDNNIDFYIFTPVKLDRYNFFPSF